MTNINKNSITRTRVFGVDCSVNVCTGEDHPNMNTICIAPSGAGKTGSMVIPSILANNGESMVISDCKRQLSKLLTPILEKRGYDVKTVDFVEPKKGCSYNPLDYIGFDMEGGKHSQLDIMNLSEALTMRLNYKGSDPFWISSAQDLISCCIAYVLEFKEREERNVISVLDIYHTICYESNFNRRFPDSDAVGHYVEVFELIGKKNPDSFAYHIYSRLKNVFLSDKTWSCIQQFANVALSPFDCEDSKQMFSGENSLDLTALAHKKSVIFLNTNCIDCCLEPLISVLYTQMIHCLIREADENGGCLEVPVHFFLDDFASTVKIPKFDKLISMIRSYDMSVSMFLQSLAQLDDMYNTSQRNIILGNCQYQVFLGAPSDMQTIEYLSQRTNKLNSTVMYMPENVVTVLERNQKPKTVKLIKPYSCLDKYSVDKPDRTDGICAYNDGDSNGYWSDSDDIDLYYYSNSDYEDEYYRETGHFFNE
ncbi:MAG: type IV secretory system conjugative DNA transfer family protein [Oscillospiraceae bacterium]